MQWADQWKLRYQITTHFCERNLHDLEDLAALLKTLRISQWSVAFPVPANVIELEETPSARQFEEAFARIYALAQKVPFKIKTSEAPHYRRYVLQQQAQSRTAEAAERPRFEDGIPGIMPVNEERGTVFISTRVRCIPVLHCRLREETSACRSLRTSTGVRRFLPCFGTRAISPANAANARSSRFVEARAPGHTPST